MAIKREILNSWGPGGWSYYEPSTDWHAPAPLQHTFAQQVQNIIAMRKANPHANLPTDEATVSAELEAYTEARWAAVYSKHGMEKFRVESAESKKKESSFTRSTSNPPAPVAEPVATARDGTPLASLAEWVGDGGQPVPRTLAEERAAICAGAIGGKPCPANQQGLLRLLTVPAATAIRGYLMLKHRMRIATSRDSELYSCEACQCVLTLKVWQPVEFVREGTGDDTLAKHREANANCWVVRELSR